MEVVQLLADSGVLWILAFTVLPVLYMLPTLVGAIRGVDGLALVFLVNLTGAPPATLHAPRLPGAGSAAVEGDVDPEEDPQDQEG